MKLVKPTVCALQEKFLTTRRELCRSLIERDEEIDLVLTALIAQEHVLLVGPPGCAKSLLLDSLMRWMDGQRFSILLNRLTTPEELLGPISLSGLKEDCYRRVTTGKLPEAQLAYLDEVFKASSAILNVMLRLLNERTHEVGDGTSKKVPLKLAVAASNEWPSPDNGKELSALFDRFTLRKSVRPIITAAGRDRLLWESNHTPALSTSITPTEIDHAHADAMRLVWTDQSKEMLQTILRELSKEGIQPGDRRQFKAVSIVNAFAYLCGGTHVEPEHLQVLAHVLWDDPIEQPHRCAQVIAKIANPTGMRINQMLLEVEQSLTATDVRNLGQAATATAKLAEIDNQLGRLPLDGRVEKARGYIREQVKKIKLASIEAI